jgi:hypothetical protein
VVSRLKVVENFGGAKKSRMTVIMRADLCLLSYRSGAPGAEMVAGAAAHHRGGPFVAEVHDNFISAISMCRKLRRE